MKQKVQKQVPKKKKGRCHKGKETGRKKRNQGTFNSGGGGVSWMYESLKVSRGKKTVMTEDKGVKS